MANFGALGTLRHAYRTLIKPSTSALARSTRHMQLSATVRGTKGQEDYVQSPQREKPALKRPASAVRSRLWPPHPKRLSGHPSRVPVRSQSTIERRDKSRDCSRLDDQGLSVNHLFLS